LGFGVWGLEFGVGGVGVKDLRFEVAAPARPGQRSATQDCWADLAIYSSPVGAYAFPCRKVLGIWPLTYLRPMLEVHPVAPSDLPACVVRV